MYKYLLRLKSLYMIYCNDVSPKEFIFFKKCQSSMSEGKELAYYNVIFDDMCMLIKKTSICNSLFWYLYVHRDDQILLIFSTEISLGSKK